MKWYLSNINLTKNSIDHNMYSTQILSAINYNTIKTSAYAWL